jgi:hypothetical protein
MRLFLRCLVLALGIFAIAAGVMAGTALAGKKAPRSGFYVFKDARMGASIEFRNRRGKLIWRDNALDGGGATTDDACTDSRHTLIGARWELWPTYRVNTGSVPAEIDPGAARTDIDAGQNAWESPFVTDCSFVPGMTDYQAFDGGTTTAGPSLALDITFDGLNTVAFVPLSQTICAGPGMVACTVAWSERGRFVEADMAIEPDLTVLGGDFHWTTGDTTSVAGGAGQLALIDVATHEFGHFAGLGHVKNSPELTMFPAVRDGWQTLGLGDMKGLLARY